MTPLQKLPKNVGDLGKLIVAKGFKKLPIVQKIAQSGHTDHSIYYYIGPQLMFLKNWQSQAYRLFYRIKNCGLDISGFRTRIVGVEGEPAYHLTTSTAFTAFVFTQPNLTSRE